MSEALELYKRETIKHLRRVCRFRRSLSAVEWSEQIRRMPGGRRFRFSKAPYQREMMETPFHPDVQMTVYMMPSRSGKTETFMNVIGRQITEDACNIIVMYPTISQSEKWSKDTLMTELVESTPELDSILGNASGKRKSGNTLLHKLFPGGSINIFGANVAGEARRAKGRLLIADEIDAIDVPESGEGDPLEILWMRGFEYPDCIKIAASYPSVQGRSRIEALMNQSDFRVLYYPCAKCGEPFVFHRDQVRYDRDRPEDAWLECPVNGCKLSEADRVKMVLSNDKWTPTRPFTGIAGFHASGLISPHELPKGIKSVMHYAAQQELAIEKAENRESSKRVLINTFDAQPYKPPTEEKPDPVGLAGEAYDYLERVSENQWKIPAGVLVVTMGGDVQGDRVEIEFVGHGMNGQTWGLGYHVLNGNPLDSEVWQKLDTLWSQSEFIHPCGKILKPVCSFLDSKYRQEKVLAFTVPRQSKGVFAIYGSTVLAKAIVSEPKRSGKGVFYEIGTHAAKAIIYQNATLRRDRKSTEFPANYMHFPIGHGYTPEYFNRLLIEDVDLKKASDGSYQQFFSNPKRLRNEPLDVRVYNIGAERKLNPVYKILAEKLTVKADQMPENASEPRQKTRNYVLDV
jgi:phage terminase large subunit GpA-like protein